MSVEPLRVVELSGGVGGARLARGLAAIPEVELTVVVNVGDDENIHGLHISPDLDTVTYTLAGVEGPEGWGRAGDTSVVNEELARFGVDNRFLLGDRDLALHVFRTARLHSGEPLSAITREVASAFDIEASVFPATDDRLATEVRIGDEEWLAFQEYFVLRGSCDEVHQLRFVGGETAEPAPGVIEAIESADAVLVGPSNPPLSIWPILAVDAIDKALRAHPRVTAVSPLIGDKALKGPAHRVMSSLGLGKGNQAVARAYDGIIDRLVIHVEDAADAGQLGDIDVLVTDTLIKETEAAREMAVRILGL